MKPKAKPTDEPIGSQQTQPFSCLRDASLFANLTGDEIAHFQNAVHVRSFKKDKTLYLQNEDAKYFYIISSGWIKLFHTMPEGDEVIVDMLTGGHMFGENALFAEEHHVCNAMVVEDAQLMSIPSSLLREQIRINPKLAFNMLGSLSRHHRLHYGHLAFNAMLSAPQRIGCFLLRLCPDGQKTDILFHFPYDKTLIADTLGMKGATFSRALNILRHKTGIAINDTRVEIACVDKLMKFVYGSTSASYFSEKI
jgi:CRP-like cAMP-binding protein